MEDLFKKFLYTGVGVVATSAEKLQTTIDDLVKRGKLSEDEGKKVVDSFVKDTEDRREDFEAKLRSTVENVMSKFDFPTSDEVNILKNRIAELEEKLGDTAKSTKKVVAKKTTTTRKRATTAAKKATTTAKKAADKVADKVDEITK